MNLFFMDDKTALPKQLKTFLERHGRAISLCCFCVFTVAVIGVGAVQTFKKASAEREILNALNESFGAESIRVYVGGAVKNKGTYDLPRSSRVEDAVSAAGGFTEDAAQESVNTAVFVEDGDEIIIPSQNGIVRSAVGKININAATVRDLVLLNGIGEVTAQKIIDYREANGLFTSLSQLKSIDGIGEKTFEGIKEDITLD